MKQSTSNTNPRPTDKAEEQQSQQAREDFSVKKRLASFVYAFKGLRTALIEQHNMRIHAGMALLVLGFGIWLKVSPTEWAVLAVCIGAVMAAELFNSAIEEAVNLASPEWNEVAGKAKDFAAGGVLMTAIGAAAAGLIIFLPKLMVCFGWL